MKTGRRYELQRRDRVRLYVGPLILGLTHYLRQAIRHHFLHHLLIVGRTRAGMPRSHFLPALQRRPL